MEIVCKTGKELGIDFEFIDLGGGLGIPYEPGEASLDLEAAAKKTADVFKSFVEQYGMKPPRLEMEPARYFVGNAGYVIGRVHAVKESYTKIVGTDVGMNVLVRPAFYGSYHHIYVDGKESEPRETMGLCGQLCENTDYWVKERSLPASLGPGDLIVVENAGAYGFGMSYQYNGRHQIISGKIGIATDKNNRDSKRHLLREELTGLLGLTNDHELYADSILYQPWTTVGQLSDVDWLMLNMLYDPDLACGMSATQAYRILLDKIFLQ